MRIAVVLACLRRGLALSLLPGLIAACDVSEPVSTSPPATNAASVAATPVPLIPLPTKVARGEGEFVLQAQAAIRVDGDDAGAGRAAAYFAGLLQDSRGARLSVRAG